ncbi:MAG TPA: lytic transglycosylase domain-containing protein [Pseudobdellovibrionaceae bacterium]|nr:lytic transglycosylase domain-containing protein [Pseudobdellovibrionaceae bacterium]
MSQTYLKSISNLIFICICLLTLSTTAPAAIPKTASLSQKLESLKSKIPVKTESQLIFDIPVSYNPNVAKWISYYQGRGRKWYREWLERSFKYLPYLQKELRRAGVPTDLAYMVMVESGFSFHAESTADAVGPWQFIESTGKRYGLNVSWWLDERKDIAKSTQAAIRYLQDLYRDFGSWYLVAASYNMGENGLRRRIQKYHTNDYWRLVQLKALPEETREYVPKILAAMLIAKAPSLYGFRDIEQPAPMDFEYVTVAGGVDLNQLADFLNVTRKSLKDLNAELLVAYVPKNISQFRIKVPKGAQKMTIAFFDIQKERLLLRQ